MTNERREVIKIEASVTIIMSASYFSHEKHCSPFYFWKTEINQLQRAVVSLCEAFVGTLWELKADRGEISYRRSCHRCCSEMLEVVGRSCRCSSTWAWRSGCWSERCEFEAEVAALRGRSHWRPLWRQNTPQSLVGADNSVTQWITLKGEI